MHLSTNVLCANSRSALHEIEKFMVDLTTLGLVWGEDKRNGRVGHLVLVGDRMVFRMGYVKKEVAVV